MDAQQAEEVLNDAEAVVPVAQGPIQDLKRLVDSLLDHGVPVALGQPEGCASGGCSPRAVLLAREEDVPAISQFMNQAWLSAVEAEGTVEAVSVGAVALGEDEELPCPACGTAAPLVEGACSDCGLHLA